MDTNVLQTLRYKLQKRLKRINTAEFQIFHGVVVQTFRFLSEHPVVRGILDDLERRVPSAESDSEQMFNGRLLTGENELEHIALGYALLKRTVASGEDKEITLGHVFAHCSKHAEAAQCFTELFIEPLFDYIDEQIDDRRVVLGLLLKYKHHIEWFRRDELRDRFEKDTQKGEKRLALDLYAYLHEQGLHFSIEPSSVSGEADLISAQTGEDRLVADVKIFDPGKSKGISYLCSGFAQVYQYSKDYNDPFGYLVVFKTCLEDLSVNALHQEATIPYFTHNNKTIFILVIDIFDYPEPASKRGHLKTYELVPGDLVRTISEMSSAPAES
jgi:hypothetical protein